MEEGNGDESGESGESCRRFALGGGSGVADEVRFKFGTRIAGVFIGVIPEGTNIPARASLISLRRFSRPVSGIAGVWDCEEHISDAIGLPASASWMSLSRCWVPFSDLSAVHGWEDDM